MSEDIKELKSLASRLNASTDALIGTLTQINEKLNALNLGISVWLEGPPLDSKLVEKPAGTTGDVYCVESKDLLGYAKTKAGWGLAVKSMRIEHGYFEGDRNAPFANPIDLGDKPLLESSRGLRVEAIKLLPELIKLLKEEANRTIGSIEEAKKLASEM